MTRTPPDPRALNTRSAGLRLFGLVWLLAFLVPGVAPAQLAVRPSEEALSITLPDEKEPASQPTLNPSSESTSALPGELQVRVDAIDVFGCSVFDADDLEPLFAPFLGRTLTTGELVQIAGLVERLYHDSGYASSYVLLPDQDFFANVLALRVVEGRIGEITIEGNEAFRADFFARRLRAAGGAPLDVEGLADQLAEFQRNPRIEQIHAVLVPGDRPDETNLEVSVVEGNAFDLTLTLSNDQPSSLGTPGGGFDASYGNLIGWGEAVSGAYRVSEGLEQWRISLEAPLGAGGGFGRLSYQRSESEIVESAFRSLEIEGRSETAEIELGIRFLRTRRLDVSSSLIGSWTRWRSTLAGRPTCFRSDQLDCRPSIAALRARQEVQVRRPDAVWLIRSTLSFGLDGLGATRETDSGLADGEFVSWLGQARHIRRFRKDRGAPLWADDWTLRSRLDLQLTNDPLLSAEQMSIGGPLSVRGVSRNLLVRDNGVIASTELRIPLAKGQRPSRRIELFPFVDFAHAWNERLDLAVETVSSAGLGLSVDIPDVLSVELTWAEPIRRGVAGGRGLQGEGIYLEVRADVF